jgi:integrase
MLDALHTELEATGIDWQARDVVFRDWRHFYAAWMADVVATDKVSRITGHKSCAVYDAYADHVTEAAITDMGKAAAVLAGVLAGAVMALGSRG